MFDIYVFNSIFVWFYVLDFYLEKLNNSVEIVIRGDAVWNVYPTALVTLESINISSVNQLFEIL